MAFPDIKLFLSDPKFQADRDFLNAVVDARVAELARAQEEARKKNEPSSIFDVLFGGGDADKK